LPRLAAVAEGADLACLNLTTASFSTLSLRKFLRDECKKANVSIQFVELEVDPDEIKNRLKIRDENTAETETSDAVNAILFCLAEKRSIVTNNK
jgi:gluconate kinase